MSNSQFSKIELVGEFLFNKVFLLGFNKAALYEVKNRNFIYKIFCMRKSNIDLVDSYFPLN